ncbi:TldD/PmbA family protein [Candidatus Hecatella orcuttiae]|jgi:TldD protein|uniref:TldD/PmbA family protein n=1 Tax=Candidatus Hecatella orcuttiae TaxID=1935119 RepID=UPI002867E261|nr:TldD/PmbA family protein [Candidatus Hecatella orcuttiae]
MEDILLYAVHVGEKLGADFVEVRGQELHKTSVTTKDGKPEHIREGFEEGLGIRVLARGAWGFLSLRKTDRESIREAAEKAYKLALTSSREIKEPVKLAEVKPVRDRVVKKPKLSPTDVSLEQKAELALSIDRDIFSLVPQVKSCTVNYLDVVGVNYYFSSEGARIQQDSLHVWLRVYATASEGEVFASASEEVGSTKGFETFERQVLEKVSSRVSRRIREQLKAELPKGGVYPAVLGSNVVGVFIHEAFGHLAEADLALAGSVTLDKMGKRIASEATSIFDDGTLPGAFGSFRYDDEGVPAQRTPLVEKGVVVGLMHSRETAGRLGVQPTGNARAESFRFTPIIRMRNTYLAPGDQSLEELLEPIRFGYYLKTLRGGQANLDGTFQVGIQEGYKVIRGEVCEPVRNLSMSGHTLQTLLKIEAVGKDFQLWPGRCGKGQTAFICDGGPSIRVGEAQLGGRG